MKSAKQTKQSASAKQNRSEWITPTISVARIATITENGIIFSSADIFNNFS